MCIGCEEIIRKYEIYISCKNDILTRKNIVFSDRFGDTQIEKRTLTLKFLI